MKSPNCGVKGSHSPYEQDPDTMKMDLGQNILEKSLLMFSEAKASWVYTRLAQKKMPKSSRMHTLTYKVESKLKKSLIIFIFIPLSSKPSSLYVSNSTFPSPQKKSTTTTIESSHSRAG